MSDTDDTDALLASDPGGGLEMFLGLSLKELADKHKSILNTSTDPPERTGAVQSVSDHSSRGTKPKDNPTTTDSTLNNLEEFDTSDFFNSQGEIVLSGLSEWTDSDVETPSADEDAGSEAGSVASFTFENALELESPKSTGIELKSIEESKQELETLPDLKETEQVDERDQEIVIDTSKHRNNHNIVTSSFKTFLDMSFGRTPSLIPRNANFGRVVDINLLKPTSGWNLPLPNHSTGQVFTRAPNFRTPGGYRPAEEPEEYRELTEDQIHEEVLRMYAFPDEVDKVANMDKQQLLRHKDENINPSQKVSFAIEDEIITDSSTKQDVSTNQSIKPPRNTKVRFDFVNGEPPVFGSEPNDEKATKRKYLIPEPGNRSGAGDCGSGSPSDSSLKFSLEDNPEPSASMPKTRSPTKKVTYSTKVVRGKRSADKKKSTGFSFGYGESENELSPIRGIGMDVFNTPGSVSSEVRLPSSPSSSSVPYNLAELKTVWREIQERKQILEENLQPNDGIISITENKDPTSVATGQELRGSKLTDENVKIMSHSKTSNYQAQEIKNSLSPSNRSQAGSSSSLTQNCPIELDHNYLPLLESFASDLETILQEADINPDEFEDIVDDLQSESNMANLVGGPQHFQALDGNEYDISEHSEAQTQLSDWAKSGAVEYVEKYHDERLRREHCEIEIQTLQKELLEIKQRNAVLEGKMKKKEKLLYQISSAWNNVSKEWKSHEAMSKDALSKLQTEHKNLVTACAEGKDRIGQYEKELMKTVELADSFKNKIVELEEAKIIAVMKIEDEKSQMAEIIGRTERDVDSLKDEKEKAERAWRETQSLLKERITAQDKIQSELVSLEEHASQNAKRLKSLTEQKEALETHLQNVTLRKEEVENQLQLLTQELETVRMEKEDLRRNLENTATRQVKDEGDRLHEYYNKKVQEILKSATEKALKAEATLTNSMRKASSETEKKLKECRERHHLEVTRLKAQYEFELQVLKKENLQKQLLITTTAQQLQSGGLERSNVVDRLQTIVSSMPDNSIVNTSEKVNKNRRRGSENSALQTAQNNIQYSKFTQNLSSSASGYNHQLAASQSADFTGFRLTTSNDVGEFQAQDNARYNKTSTPIITTSELLTDSSNYQSCPSKDSVLYKASKLCKYFETANSNLAIIPESRTIGTDNILNDIRMNDYTLKSLEQNTRFRSSSLKNTVQVLKSVDPLLETPVKLQKERGQMEAEVESHNNTELDRLDAMIDPALQKCLEELIKSYAQKLDVIQTQKESPVVSDAVVQTRDVPVHNKVDVSVSATAIVAKQPKNKVKVSNSKTEKVKSCSSGNPACASENDNVNNNCNIKGDKDSSKDKTVGNQASGKRPWK